MVYFLAYVLWKTLEQWQRRAVLGQSPRTIPRRTPPRSECRCRPADRGRPRTALALRGAARHYAGRAPRSPRPRTSRTPQNPVSRTRKRARVVPTFCVNKTSVLDRKLTVRPIFRPRLGELGRGLVEPVQRKEGAAEIVTGARVLRFELDGFLKVFSTRLAEHWLCWCKLVAWRGQVCQWLRSSLYSLGARSEGGERCQRDPATSP